MKKTEFNIIENTLPYFHNLSWKIGISKGVYYPYKLSEIRGYYWMNTNKNNPQDNLFNSICVDSKLLKKIKINK